MYRGKTAKVCCKPGRKWYCFQNLNKSKQESKRKRNRTKDGFAMGPPTGRECSDILEFLTVRFCVRKVGERERCGDEPDFEAADNQTDRQTEKLTGSHGKQTDRPCGKTDREINKETNGQTQKSRQTGGTTNNKEADRQTDG